MPLPALTGVVFLMMVLVSTTLSAQVKNTPPEELRILEPCVGQFKVETVGKADIRGNGDYSAKGANVGKPAHDGWFLHWEGYAESKEFGRIEWTEMITYDRRLQQYKRFTFTSEGLAVVSLGDWDPDKSTIFWKPTDPPPGWEITSTTKIEKDKVTHTVLTKNDKGQVMRDFVSTSTRQIEAGKEPRTK